MPIGPVRSIAPLSQSAILEALLGRMSVGGPVFRPGALETRNPAREGEPVRDAGAGRPHGRARTGRSGGREHRRRDGPDRHGGIDSSRSNRPERSAPDPWRVRPLDAPDPEHHRGDDRRADRRRCAAELRHDA